MEGQVTHRYHLTFDIDWAPDASIALCLDLLNEHGIKGTFFATHETDLNKEILLHGHELGIHPNFLPNTTHGENPQKIIETCLGFAPCARYMRTHSLVQSSRLLYEVFGKFTQLTTDVSLFMHKAKHVQKCRWQFDGVAFNRILYNWEDDAEFCNDLFDYSTACFFGQMTIFDFHPIHVDLNSRNGASYDNLKSSLGSKSLHQASAQMIATHRNTELGATNFLRSILSSSAQAVTLEDV